MWCRGRTAGYCVGNRMLRARLGGARRRLAYQTFCGRGACRQPDDAHVRGRGGFYRTRQLSLRGVVEVAFPITPHNISVCRTTAVRRRAHCWSRSSHHKAWRCSRSFAARGLIGGELFSQHPQRPTSQVRGRVFRSLVFAECPLVRGDRHVSISPVVCVPGEHGPLLRKVVPVLVFLCVLLPRRIRRDGQSREL